MPDNQYTPPGRSVKAPPKWPETPKWLPVRPARPQARPARALHEPRANMEKSTNKNKHHAAAWASRVTHGGTRGRRKQPGADTRPNHHARNSQRQAPERPDGSPARNSANHRAAQNWGGQNRAPDRRPQTQPRPPHRPRAPPTTRHRPADGRTRIQTATRNGSSCHSARTP